MISPEDIKQQALSWWKPFLQSYITGESFFPKQLQRIGKVGYRDMTRRFEALQSEIAALQSGSKTVTGAGYLIQTKERHFRRTGSHELPDSVVFETADDYLHFIDKRKEWQLFILNYERLTESLPQLTPWIKDNPLLLTYPDTDWQGMIEVCRYFIANPRPELYIRQLPIPVHTKFIEQNELLVQSLLDFLLPQHIRNEDHLRCTGRYYLKLDEPLIRIRILDPHEAIHKNIFDLSIRLSDFEATKWAAEKVLITENKMNFLTLPELPDAIAIWSGGGFNVSYLKNTAWLRNKNIYYWGDIDEHGFQILHQLRRYFGQTKSLMMDQQTFDRFQEFVVPGERNRAEKLDLLTKEEAALYELLKSKPNANRLEQEKIPQDYADTILYSL